MITQYQGKYVLYFLSLVAPGEVHGYSSQKSIVQLDPAPQGPQLYPENTTKPLCIGLINIQPYDHWSYYINQWQYRESRLSKEGYALGLQITSMNSAQSLLPRQIFQPSQYQLSLYELCVILYVDEDKKVLSDVRHQLCSQNL